MSILVHMNGVKKNIMTVATIARIMEEVRKKKEQSGVFLSKNIQNAATKHRETMDCFRGINKHWSSAKNSLPTSLRKFLLAA